MSSQFDRSFWLAAVREHVSERIATLVSELKDLQQGNADNEKSTVGDKHDTERAMVHLEMENLSERLAGERRNMHGLDQIDSIYKATGNIGLGTVVETNKGVFLLGIPCGKVIKEGAMITGISLESPLAIAMMGKSAGDVVVLNQLPFTINAVD